MMRNGRDLEIAYNGRRVVRKANRERKKSINSLSRTWRRSFDVKIKIWD
jgi:hypothetical protein